MEVYGYDPYLSVDAAWKLSRQIYHAKTTEEIYKECDYITIHVPALESTKGMINAEALSLMKDGVIILNYARDVLVDEVALLEAMDAGKVKKYITDFANPTVAGKDNVIVTPHLAASTEESEDNCAKMAVKEVMEFLEFLLIISPLRKMFVPLLWCLSCSMVDLIRSGKRQKRLLENLFYYRH